MLRSAIQKCSVFFFFPPLSELISRYNCKPAQLIFYFMLELIHAVYIKVMNGSFCLERTEDMYDLTIRVSVAECAVFVLLFDFHLHCLAPALECKQAPLPGSAKRLGAITQSAWLHKDMQNTFLQILLNGLHLTTGATMIKAAKCNFLEGTVNCCHPQAVKYWRIQLASNPSC